MTQPLFKGAMTALVTPFRDGAIDEEAFIRLVERQVAAGIHGLVPVGTTGETSTLSHDEHKRVVELCVKTVAGRARVIAGAGANATAEAIDLVRHAKTVGADAALVVTPYYNRPSQEGLYRHYEAINNAVQLPVLTYNVPGRTGVDMANDTMERVSKLPNIIGVKDATGIMDRIALQRLTCGAEWNLISGDDGSALGYMAHGGHGVISVTSNVAPEAVVAFMNACLQGAWETALYWQDRLARLNKAMFLDSSPAPAKFAMAELGLCSDETRLPIAPCNDAVKPAIREAMRDVGVLLMAGKLIAENRRARFDYFLEDALEAGIALTGTEVKSLRVGRANIAESYASVENGEIVLINADIPPYAGGNRFNHEPRRHRKLLLHKKQIGKLIVAIQREGRTIVPTKLYWNDKGIAKLEIMLAKGKKAHDKREATAERDWQRDKARLMREKG